MRSPLVVLLASAPLLACAPERVVVVLHAAEADLPYGVRIAVDDLAEGLSRMGGERLVLMESTLPAGECLPGEVHIEVQGVVERPNEPAQSYRASDRRCAAGGRVLRLEGSSHLAAQWVIYDVMKRLGVRFFHPEQTYFPPRLVFPDDDLSLDEQPALQRRSIGVHRTHPVELSPPLAPSDDVDMAALQRRWIDWNVKLRQTTVNGWDASVAGSYAYQRGFPRETGFNLLNSQQGGRPILDPDDPRSEREQIEEAIDELMQPVEGWPAVSAFSFQFNPSEFTEAETAPTIERLRIISEHLSAGWPDVEQYTINHGTAQPYAHNGMRFFDLPATAPPALGVKVHPLMFYDLERPAPVYGNDDFSHLLAWGRAQAAVRRIVHFPEASWWLTFDLPVPLYLAPVTLEARQHDLDLLRSALSTSEADPRGVYGHQLFSSGQEWGYWLVDWCVADMTWDLDYRHDDCLATFASALARGDELYRVLEEVEARQLVDMRDPELIRFLVGSDDETEIAEAAGIRFHPLPPRPEEVPAYDDARARVLEEKSLAPLEEMARDYAAFAARVALTLPFQREEQAAFVREIHDGLALFSLRARHAVEVYRTVLALRGALAAGDLDAVNASYGGVDEARRLTALARAHVEARERDYRYPPELTIAGDEPGSDDAVPNLTVYPYRYLSRTHRMFYWVRPDEQLASLYGEGLDLVTPSHRVLPGGAPLVVTVAADELGQVQIDWGDGARSVTVEPHDYAAHGFYSWVIDATTTAGAIHHEDQVAVVDTRYLFLKGALLVEYPAGADVLEGLLPGLELGLGDDGAEFLAVGRIDDEGEQATNGSLMRRARAGMTSGPADLAMEIKDVGAVNVLGAVLELDAADPDATLLRVEGEMRTQEVIDLLVSVGGFDAEGARELVASLLDYTPETLPEVEAMILRATGRKLP